MQTHFTHFPPKRMLLPLVLQVGQTDRMDTTKRSSWWSITINNPTSDDEECMALARQMGWTIEGQLEEGEEGTPHYQLAVRSPGQVRFSAVKKLFPRGHIEPARQPAALKRYVVKEETRLAELPTSQEMYPSLSRYWDLLVEQIDALNPHIFTSWIGVEQWDEGKGGMPLPTAVEAMTTATSALIERGYHVESIAANPATISQWKKFHVALMRRVMMERRASEREDSLSSVTNTTDASQEVTLPQACPPPPPPPGWTGGPY